MPQNVHLERIDEQNYLDCFALQLAPGQERFASHPVRSLAQAYVYYHQCTPFGVYDGSEMVGYVLVIYDDDEKSYNLWHLMIDQSKQGMGYGEKAVELCLRYIRTQPFGASDLVLLTCHEDNACAMHIYQELGFAPTGNVFDDEAELALHVPLGTD